MSEDWEACISIHDNPDIDKDWTTSNLQYIDESGNKCTAVIIHPSTQWNPDEPNLEKLIKRAGKISIAEIMSSIP